MPLDWNGFYGIPAGQIQVSWIRLDPVPRNAL